MINKYLTQGLTAGFISLLAACGGGGNSDGSAQSPVGSDPGTSAPEEPVAADPAVQEMAGLWDFTVNFDNGTQDRYYWHFIADGTARAYDYMGDSHDGGQECHRVYEGSLQAVENSVFVLAIDSEEVYAQMQVDGQQLQFDDERLSKLASVNVDSLTRCDE